MRASFVDGLRNPEGVAGEIFEEADGREKRFCVGSTNAIWVKPIVWLATGKDREWVGTPWFALRHTDFFTADR
jgi:hypothetical protein